MAIGPTLQEARLSKQLTTSQVAELTRMKVQIVDDLENDDFHRMAATIYGKGFIKLFAECVGLDPVPLVADYVRSVEGDKPSLIPDGGKNAPAAKPATTKVAKPEAEPETEPEPATEPNVDTEVTAPPEAEAVEEDASDLFTYASKGKRIVNRPAEPSAPSLAHATSEKISRAGATLRQSLAHGFAACRDGLERAVNRLADIPWGDAPLKAIGVIIGILVVLLFVVSGISRCVGPQQDGEPAEDGLHIAIDTPEPYFD
ncbi:MAG: helix-turn-helix domain-containing protein [Verrucomicrobia bacterium]|jgi:hypothetical protein|nr:helix-turn-helix domain-containing protein [Verrucomicrobiota bacterium]